MYTIKFTPEFAKWFSGLKDNLTRVRLNRRLARAVFGNLGDVKPVGEKVWEMREFFGPGWRLYYTLRGETLIVMLGGGDKSTQVRDIAEAIEIASAIREEKDE